MSHRAPEFIDPVVGVRQWSAGPWRGPWPERPADEPILLWPFTGGEPWPPDEDMVAKCQRTAGHAPPVYDCGCGLWAFHSLKELSERYSWTGGGLMTDMGTISGVVSGWGEVIPYDNGWRSEVARVEALFYHPAFKPGLYQPVDIRGLAATYGADVIPLHAFDDYCERRGFVRLG